VIGILPALSGIAVNVTVAALFGLCNIKEHLKTVLRHTKSEHIFFRELLLCLFDCVSMIFTFKLNKRYDKERMECVQKSSIINAVSASGQCRVLVALVMR